MGFGTPRKLFEMGRGRSSWPKSPITRAFERMTTFGSESNEKHHLVHYIEFITWKQIRKYMNVTFHQVLTTHPGIHVLTAHSAPFPPPQIPPLQPGLQWLQRGAGEARGRGAGPWWRALPTVLRPIMTLTCKIWGGATWWRDSCFSRWLLQWNLGLHTPRFTYVSGYVRWLVKNFASVFVQNFGLRILIWEIHDRFTQGFH